MLGTWQLYSLTQEEREDRQDQRISVPEERENPAGPEGARRCLGRVELCPDVLQRVNAVPRETKA